MPADRGDMIMKAIGKAGGKQAELIVFEDKGMTPGGFPIPNPSSSSGSSVTRERSDDARLASRPFLGFAPCSLCALWPPAGRRNGKTPSLPKPSQVDKPGMIRFIKPDPKALPGIVVDGVDAKLIGQWKHSVHTPPFVGQSYLHDMKEAKGKKSATFVPPTCPRAGRYEVRMSHNSNVRRANGVRSPFGMPTGKARSRSTRASLPPSESSFAAWAYFVSRRVGADPSPSVPRAPMENT